ncbi:MAG: DoxX family protein [Solirubrobacteraceae bacterium]
MSRRLCAAFFTGAGILHFVRPKLFEQIVPPGFGDPHALVIASGVAEVIGGAAIGSGRADRFSRLWLLGLLASVFPANVYMALEPDKFRGVPPAALWARLPLQPLMMLWIWRITRRPAPARPTS